MKKEPPSPGSDLVKIIWALTGLLATGLALVAFIIHEINNS